jgi:hypothetical protein
MNRTPGVRILAVMGLLATAALGSSSRAWAQTSAGQSPSWQSPALRPAASPSSGGENQLHIIAAQSLPSTYGSAGMLRFVQDTELTQAEPIGPGAVQGNEPPMPPSATIPVSPSSPPGNYEAIDTGWKPIGDVSASIAAPAGELPENFAATRFAQAGEVHAPINESHDWPTLSYAWEASAVGHNPLYFEDVNLERYGYSRGILQPLFSGVRFFTTVVCLPYKIVAHRPGEIIYPLGYCRPGDPAPPVRQRERIKFTAAAAEAAFVVGMLVILP